MKTLLVCLLALPLVACTPPDAPNGDAPAPAAADCPWNYENTNWWELCPPSYALCRAGREQSPIDLARTEPANLPKLEFKYRQAVFDVAPYYFDQELQAHPRPDGDEPLSLSIAGEPYRLIQLHFHTPCEHCADRPKYSLELHLVHKNDDGVTAVVGVRVDPGGANEAFQAFVDTIPPSGPPGGVAEFDPSDLLPENHGYVHYPGSLTTPGCGEGVLWHVLEARTAASREQMDRFQGRYPKTARPLQERGDRLPKRSRD